MATKQYMLENDNRCPKDIRELVAQKYLETSNARDSWRREFVFKCPGTHVPDAADITSFGPDGREGTADDIRSWEL